MRLRKKLVKLVSNKSDINRSPMSTNWHSTLDWNTIISSRWHNLEVSNSDELNGAELPKCYLSIKPALIPLRIYM